MIKPFTNVRQFSFIDDKEIENAKTHWRKTFGSLKQPIFGLFIGGATKRRPFTINHGRELGELVSKLVAASDAN